MAESPRSESGEGDKEKTYLGEYHGRRNIDGKRVGYAWTILPNNDIYVGNYVEGQRNGKGLYVFKDGCRYDGHWEQNTKHGTGKIIYPDATTYEGKWKKNLRHGHGTYYYLNGDTYEGSWKDGLRHGLGVYTFLHSNVIVKGVWSNGHQNGPGKIIYPTYTYYGTWIDGARDGKGYFIFYDKCILEGMNIRHLKEKEKEVDENQEDDESHFEESEASMVEIGESSKVIEREESKILAHVEWVPLRILKFDTNRIPPEPTYEGSSFLSVPEGSESTTKTFIEEVNEQQKSDLSVIDEESI